VSCLFVNYLLTNGRFFNFVAENLQQNPFSGLYIGGIFTSDKLKAKNSTKGAILNQTINRQGKAFLHLLFTFKKRP
jgi:hypothetical protein